MFSFLHVKYVIIPNEFTSQESKIPSSATETLIVDKHQMLKSFTKA